MSRASALEQRQRAGEREIRRLKRLEASCLDPDTRRRYREQLQAAQKDMREFVAEHGDILRRDYWREKGRLDGGNSPFTPENKNDIIRYKMKDLMKIHHAVVIAAVWCIFYAADIIFLTRPCFFAKFAFSRQ
ncbi:MAG: hypothetical protein PHD67_06865 [Oscillospiraceae bacterium]|nr:hypothetical protein [Oscillospiraceae bacterium]